MMMWAARGHGLGVHWITYALPELEPMYMQARVEPLHEPDHSPEPPPLWERMLHLAKWSASDDGGVWRLGLARYALEREGDAGAGDAGTDLLAGALRESLRRLHDALEAAGEDTKAADEALVTCLLRTGGDGVETGSALRSELKDASPENRERLWLRPLEDEDVDVGILWRAPWAEALARCLWADSVRGRWLRATRNPPGLTRPVLALAIRLTSPATTRRVECDGRQLSLLDHAGEIGRTEPLALTDLAALAQVLERGADALQSATAVKLIIGVVIKGQAIIHEDPHLNPRPTLIYEGLEDLARELGLPTNTRVIEGLLDALRAGQMLNLQWPGREVGGLWTFDRNYSGGNGYGRKGVLEIAPAKALLPNYVHQLSTHDRLIAPLTPLGALSASKRVHRAEAALHLRLAVVLTERSTQIPGEGGVRLEKADIGRLARDVGASGRVVEAALDRWSCDGDTPAVLERVASDRYTYAANDCYGPARSWLEQTGELRLGRSKAGQASVVKRSKSNKKQ